MNTTPQCVPRHTPDKARRMVDDKTGRIFYRKHCKHCGDFMGDELTQKTEPAIELLHTIMRRIQE